MGAPFGSSCSFGVVGFTRIRPMVHSGSLDSRGCALVVSGFIRGRWVHADTPSRSSGSFVDVRFTLARPRGRRIHSGLFGSRACALQVVGFIRGI